MRRTSILVILLAPAIASADMLSPMVECPAGQMHVGAPGCPGHGASTRCAPARCIDDARCGEGNRCVEVARCFETVSLRCVSGDGRRPISERTERTFDQDQERGPCGPAGECPERAVCRRFGECQPAPPVVAPPPAPLETIERAPPRTRRESSGGCAIGPTPRPRGLGVALLLLLAVRARWASRRTSSIIAT